METSGKTVAQISRELGIHESVLHRWKRQFRLNDGELSVVEQNDLEAENARLRRENQRLMDEREVLKKAIAIFSQVPE